MQYPNYEYRYIGPILPFVGGLLVGGLFAPTKGPLYPSSSQPTPIYYQPVQYYPVNNGMTYPPYPYYSFPVNGASNPNYMSTSYVNKYPYQKTNPYYPE